MYRRIYIPGYPGSNSNTAKGLQLIKPSIEVFEYDPNCPQEFMALAAKKLLEMDEWPIIMASSLGGWFAERLATKVPCSLVLWNPSLRPNMLKYGIAPYEPIDRLEIVPRDVPRIIFLGQNDDVVPPEFASQLYTGVGDVRHMENVGHRMTPQGLKMMVKACEQLEEFSSDNS